MDDLLNSFFHGAYDDNDLSTFQQYSMVVVDFAAKVISSS